VHNETAENRKIAIFWILRQEKAGQVPLPGFEIVNFVQLTS